MENFFEEPLLDEAGSVDEDDDLGDLDDEEETEEGGQQDIESDLGEE